MISIRTRVAAWLSFVGVVLSLSAGCSSLVAARPPLGAYVAPPERCASLDDRSTLWGAVGATAAAFAGGAGLSTIPVQDPGARVGLAIGAATMGAVAAGAVLVSQQSAAAFVRDGCAAPVDPKKQVGVVSK